MKIIEDKNNELLNRREVKIVIEANKNPSMQESTKMIADEFKASEENISLKVVKGKFGRKTFLVVASIYNNKEDKEKTEVTTKKQRTAKRESDKKSAEKAPGAEENKEAIKGESK
jgi:ribosomal protein S24E